MLISSGIELCISIVATGIATLRPLASKLFSKFRMNEIDRKPERNILYARKGSSIQACFANDGLNWSALIRPAACWSRSPKQSQAVHSTTRSMPIERMVWSDTGGLLDSQVTVPETIYRNDTRGSV